MMSAIFEASAQSSVTSKAIHLLIVITVTASMVAVAWFMDGIFIRGIVLLVAVVCMVMIKSVASDLIAYKNAERGWRVKIDNFTLSWQSPVERLFRSFTIKLNDIQRLRYLQVHSNSKSGGGSRRVFLIHLKDGRTMDIPAQEGGISVNDVFEALEKKSITYDRESWRKVKFNKEKKSLGIIQMEAWGNSAT